MDDERLRRLVGLACEDVGCRETRKAKDRLRSVLHASPHYTPALELIGYLHYQDGDWRNAAMYWVRAEIQSDEMTHACNRVFRSISRALIRENLRSAQYNLYAFADASLPDELEKKLSMLEAAYQVLSSKRAKVSGLACAPLSGGCLIIMLGILSLVIGAGWSWFLWMGSLAVATTAIVAGISAWSYFRAIRTFHRAMSMFQSSVDGRSPS